MPDTDSPSPADDETKRSYAIAEQKRSLAAKLKNSDNPNDHSQARTQEVQADQIEEDARERAEAAGVQAPDRGKLP